MLRKMKAVFYEAAFFMRRMRHATDPSNPKSRNCGPHKQARSLSCLDADKFRPLLPPRQFSQSQNSFAHAFREVSRDYCIPSPLLFSTPLRVIQSQPLTAHFWRTITEISARDARMRGTLLLRHCSLVRGANYVVTLGFVINHATPRREYICSAAAAPSYSFFG